MDADPWVTSFWQSFTHVDPFEDTERPATERQFRTRALGFTHVDPFEDTERLSIQMKWCTAGRFHPRRSVRGY